VEQQLLAWLSRYGAPVLFAAQMFGIFGLPVPDEVLLTVAGALVRQGRLGAASTAAAAVAGCMCGITLSYVLGRTVGLAAVRRVLRLHEVALHRAQTWFERFGGWLLAFGYFIPGVRHVTAIAAGSTPLDYRTFALYAYPGALLWCAVFLGVGYYAGDRWRELAALVRRHGALVALGVLGLFFLYTAARRRTGRSRGPV
jgi:membrane protein DedA with SNARE-associated domain